MTDDRMTPEQRFQQIAAILAAALLRLHVQKPAESSKVSLAVPESSRLTVRVA